MAGPPPAIPPASSRFVTFMMWALLVSVLAAVGAVGVVSYMSARQEDEALPVLGQVTAFELTDRSGRSVGRGDLVGAPWVADFIFTRCTGICPILTSRMGELQALLHARPEVRLVSISVDPEHDTPEVLADYAGRQGADPGRWLFLTGDWQTTRRLVADGFKLAVSRADAGEAAEGELVTHSDRLVLVDARGRIRAYYHGSDDDVAIKVAEDIERLNLERPQ